RLAHLAPRWWHRLEVLGSHAVQLGVIWLILLPQPIASVAACLVILTQLFLVVTGNYAWLNWLTILVAFSAIRDSFLRWAAGGACCCSSWSPVCWSSPGGRCGTSSPRTS